MGVDREAREVEADRAHDVAGLAPHAGQPDEVVELARHLAPEFLLELAGHAQQAARLRVEEARGADEAFELVGIGACEIGRRRVAREQLRRDLVDRLVGGLRREDGRDEELERPFVHERALRVGILGRQPRDHLGCTGLRAPRPRHRWTLPPGRRQLAREQSGGCRRRK